jgi:CxxC motif-containing protein (DUF1111 family)
VPRLVAIFFIILCGSAAPAYMAVDPATDNQNTVGVFGDSIPDLSPDESRAFQSGYQLFIKTWKQGPPARKRVLNGLSCIECHVEPMPGGSGTVPRTYVFLSHLVADSTGGHVFRRFAVLEDSTLQSIPAPRDYSLRKTPALFGLGLLEAAEVHGENSVTTEDSHSRRSDDDLIETTRRFGWRGEVASVQSFVEQAFASEIGLRTPQFNFEPEKTRVDLTDISKPDVSSEEILLVTQFLRFLGPPKPKRPDFLKLQGADVFEEIGCGACHASTLRTGNSDVTALRFKVIHPYSDLRTHEMGRSLADCEDESIDKCARFRTPPLWGLTSTGPPFMHDARAHTIEDAIRFHSGEATNSVLAYESLGTVRRAALLDFLNSL